MQLDRLAFDEHRLERLDAQAVAASARGSSSDRVLADDLFGDVPDHRRARSTSFFAALMGGGGAVLRRLRKIVNGGNSSAPSQLGRRPPLGYSRQAPGPPTMTGTARVVDRLAQQVLAEAAALACPSVMSAERLRAQLVRAGHVSCRDGR